MTTFSLEAQIAEVDREIKMRVDVYARQIASGKMKRSIAEYHTDCMGRAGDIGRHQERTDQMTHNPVDEEFKLMMNLLDVATDAGKAR